MKSFDCPHCHKIFKSDSAGLEIVTCPHCNGTVSLPEKDLPAGTIVAGFKIISLLGKGGMGNVYLANQISMDRLVALKILLKSFSNDKESVEQFLNEARVSGRLDHENIIPAIDAGECDGTNYLASAYIDGEDLEHRLDREHIISEKEAIEISIKIAYALQYSWDSFGLLHKDIKPGNIMYDKKGEVFLMDMGIAQYISDDSKKEEHILGSPFYMSPEQTTASRLSWTSDLYSLGATIYNLIVGLPPFDAPEVMKIIEMHTTEPFPEPLTRNATSEVTEQTVELLRKMMMKNALERFDSWAGFIEAAEDCLKQFQPEDELIISSITNKKGKKKAPVKKAKVKSLPKKNPTRRKKAPQSIQTKSNPLTTIVSYILVLIIASILAYVVFNHRKELSAENSIKRAERFYQDHPGKYNSLISKFREVKAKCKGTSFEDRVEDRLKSIKKEKATQSKLKAEYKIIRLKAAKLATNRKYTQAIRLLIDSIKHIKDPLIIKEAEMKINIYRTARDRK